MKWIILPMTLCIATFLMAQEGTRSKAECEADAIHWNVTVTELQKLQDGPISITELDHRATVLLGCALTYMPMQESHYRDLSEVYDHASNIRVEHFFQRHPEIRAKLVQDDESGLR